MPKVRTLGRFLAAAGALACLNFLMREERASQASFSSSSLGADYMAAMNRMAATAAEAAGVSARPRRWYVANGISLHYLFCCSTRAVETRRPSERYGRRNKDGRMMWARRSDSIRISSCGCVMLVTG